MAPSVCAYLPLLAGFCGDRSGSRPLPAGFRAAMLSAELEGPSPILSGSCSLLKVPSPPMPRLPLLMRTAALMNCTCTDTCRLSAGQCMACQHRHVASPAPWLGASRMCMRTFCFGWRRCICAVLIQKCASSIRRTTAWHARMHKPHSVMHLTTRESAQRDGHIW